MVASTSSLTLLRHFQTAVGMTPLDYLHRVRVDRAKVLLEVTQHNLHAIALACGYSDASSFSRMFSKIAGISPGVYRQRFTMRSKRVRWRAESPESSV
ncbi:HTH-type transcriptional activator RhaR [compost metagenome]